MKEVIKANFKIGDNNDIAGVMDCGSSSKKFSCWSTGVIDVESHSNVYGKTHDRKDVSLLNCLKTGEEHKLNFKSQESSYSCEIFSHTMIVGNEKIDPAEDKFESISFNVGNPSKLFNNFDSFGYIDAISPNLADALNEQEFTTPFDAERTILGYFNGEFTIFKKTTEIGLISAHCYVSHNADVFSGVKIENKFIITIEFNASITLDEGFKRANLVSSFLHFFDSSLVKDFSSMVFL